MGEVLYVDFRTKDRSYTKGGGIDELLILPVIRNDGERLYIPDTAPCEYVAPESDSA